ncbi:MAG: GTPase, partial [Desulfuromonadaceae bacterium]|nr:GTPase [Desulfuromonadaceae bacterium]
INSADADIVLAATPCDLGGLIKINKPLVRVRYEFEEVGDPKLSDLIREFLRGRNLV